MYFQSVLFQVRIIFVSRQKSQLEKKAIWEESKSAWEWQNRSVFVVGDADQSIYSFRMADFTILLEFQQDFGDGLTDDDTRSMVKLEENYRSCENILQAANELIENNTQRIDKVLKPTRGAGDLIYCHRADNEIEEVCH